MRPCWSFSPTRRMTMEGYQATASKRGPWNKAKVTGAKPPLRPKHVWSIRTKLQMADRKRDLALFNLAIDSKLRGCDVVALKVEDIAPHGSAIERDSPTEEDRPAGAVRDYRTNPPGGQRIPPRGKQEARPISFRRAASTGIEPLDPAICPSPRRLDTQQRARPLHVRYAFTGSN